jgi:hypothetical protein
MNFPLSKLQARVNLGVLRADVAAASNNYADFINTARLELQNKRSWSFMKASADLTILTGNLTVAMPDGFKELQPENSNGCPVSFILHDPNTPGAVWPVSVYFEAQEIRRLWLLGGMVSVWFGEMRVFLRKNAAGAVLGVEVPATEPLEFRIEYIGYLPELSAPTDECPMTNAYPEMVIAKAKSLALASINDGAAVAMETLSDAKFKEASLSDARSDLVGRELRM